MSLASVLGGGSMLGFQSHPLAGVLMSLATVVLSVAVVLLANGEKR